MYFQRAIFKTGKQLNNVFPIFTKTISNESNIVKSKSPPIAIPNQLINEYIWQNMDKWHSKTAVISFETGKSYTFTEIYTKSQSVAYFLHQKLHLSVGDTVAVILPNVPDFPIAFLGALQAGLVITTANPFYTVDEMATQLDDSDTKLIFTVAEIIPVITKATKKIKKKIPTIVTENTPGQVLPQGCMKLTEICDIHPEITYNNNLRPEDVILLPYSSGTTGLSKGVQLTHKNIVSNLYQMSSPDFIVNLKTEGDCQDVIPVFLPLFHIYGMVGIFLNFFAQGCKLVMVSNFVGSQFNKFLHTFQPTLLFAVPPTISVILNNNKIRYEDLQSIRTIISAAAPLGPLDVNKFRDKTHDKINLLQMFGMTETSPLTLMQTTKLKNGTKTGGSGFLIPNTEARVISPLNLNLEKFERGELIVKGPQVMKGYHKNPDASRESLLDGDWLKTGDVCYFDEDEHFFITGRLKELIKVRGFQVAPAELEEVLRSHSVIADAAVVGIPHPTQGEVPKAFVVLKAGNTLKSEEIKNFVASKVVSYKRLLGGVSLIDKIPRNSAGKILRRELRDM